MIDLSCRRVGAGRRAGPAMPRVMPFMESFFSSLMSERIRKKVYRTRAKATADAFDNVECFGNPKPPHSTLGYLSPIDFEREAGKA